jgi:thioredoxin reductase
VHLAIGQLPDLSFLDAEDRISADAGRDNQVATQTMATSAPSIYAGGDVAFGRATSSMPWPMEARRALDSRILARRPR